jgi:hypothetical protein
MSHRAWRTPRPYYVPSLFATASALCSIFAWRQYEPLQDARIHWPHPRIESSSDDAGSDRTLEELIPDLPARRRHGVRLDRCGQPRARQEHQIDEIGILSQPTTSARGRRRRVTTASCFSARGYRARQCRGLAAYAALKFDSAESGCSRDVRSRNRRSNATEYRPWSFPWLKSGMKYSEPFLTSATFPGLIRQPGGRRDTRRRPRETCPRTHGPSGRGDRR